MAIFCSIFSASIMGIKSCIISVETDISNGLPYFSMVGLLSSEVRESKERVRAAIMNSGYEIFSRKITVNLSPADIRKDGTGFDLAIAISILTCMGYIKKEKTKDTVFIGELGLDGKIKPVFGILPIIITAKENNFKTVLIPKENLNEAIYIEGIKVIGIETLAEAISFLNSDTIPHQKINKKNSTEDDLCTNEIDFRDICGQKNARRAAEIAAAGRHNLLLSGPPGSGKTMIAKRLPTILNSMNEKEYFEVAKIYSVMGLLTNNNIIKRPFREPFNTISLAGMAGGRANPKPGEITLAHKGVLFLDEFLEFKREVIECLRLPLEEKIVRISRSEGSYIFPADFMLVAATNPCYCGYYPDKNKCKCSDYEVKKYQNKMNSPIMDRIDLCAVTNIVSIDEIKKENTTEASSEIKKRVDKAVEIQCQRYINKENKFNSSLTNSEIKKICNISQSQNRIMESAFQKMNLSARAYYKILKVARTIADLAGEEVIKDEHLLEAISFRIK